MALTLIAAYDVREDARRAHLAALLQSYGNRVQKSVFVLIVDETELTEIRSRAAAIIDVDTDSLWFAHECATCWAKLETMGQVGSPERTLYWAVM